MTNTFYGKYGPGQNTLRKPAPETQHTPTPWELNGSEHGANSPLVNMCGFVGDKYKKLGDLRNFSSSDRAFIVRAVNAHDSLVAALSLAVDLQDLGKTAFEEKYGFPKIAYSERGEAAWNKARAALAAAKGDHA